jgi:hypothetical protein
MMDQRVHAPAGPSSPSKGVRLLHSNGSSISREERNLHVWENVCQMGSGFARKVCTSAYD